MDMGLLGKYVQIYVVFILLNLLYNKTTWHGGRKITKIHGEMYYT